MGSELGPKVFGIGFHKTGTTSLRLALEELGYRVTGPNGVHRKGMNTAMALAIAHDLLPRFDAFQDNPWANLFREMDGEAPGSRFVLTVRPEEAWLRSVVGHFGPRSTPMREWIYGAGFGSPIGNEELYAERYRRHNREVLEHFAERPDDLLVMDITEGDGWAELCPFLGRPVPDAPFPHSNSASARSTAGPLRRARWRVRWATRRLRR
ncbi:MAG TPA: sulfotransferase [Actinomycetota bacterium]